jgi:hypothetical protein
MKVEFEDVLWTKVKKYAEACGLQLARRVRAPGRGEANRRRGLAGRRPASDGEASGPRLPGLRARYLGAAPGAAVLELGLELELDEAGSSGAGRARV